MQVDKLIIGEGVLGTIVSLARVLNHPARARFDCPENFQSRSSSLSSSTRQVPFYRGPRDRNGGDVETAQMHVLTVAGLLGVTCSHGSSFCIDRSWVEKTGFDELLAAMQQGWEVKVAMATRMS